MAVYFSCLFFYCSAYSIVILFCYYTVNHETYSKNEANNNSYINYTYCDFVIYEAQEIASYLDLANRQLIPMILMLGFSCLRSRVASSLREQNRVNRDVKLTINCFVMSFIFFACNTPTSVVNFFFDVSYLLFCPTTYVFYLSYGVNFYILFGCNSLIQEEFLSY